ncbi:MAG: AAA family ATPase [Acutalibacteraceae bacterium]|nr:AAA family ATPase [Acutalibacteraceae bacterium]
MIFSIEDNVFLDKSKVKIIDSVAGAGKSSLCHSFFENNGIPYARYTSTNTLKRDAEERYCMTCQTIAGGLFNTDNEHMIFYSDFKSAECQNVVIDEALQASERVWDWIEENIGKVNIIVTTDSHQTLAPKSEKVLKQRYQEFINRDDVVYVNITETLRARDEETKQAFEFWYKEAEFDKLIPASQICKQFPVVSFEDVEYSENNAYITHTKEIEKHLYKTWNMSSRYDVQLVQKGRIASRKLRSLNNYPILSQKDAEDTKCSAYLQIKNIACCTRYQGSEVSSDNTLYYFIESKSLVSSRELYTTITRLWQIKDLRIVIVDIEHYEKLREFRGLKIKEKAYIVVDEEKPGANVISSVQMKKIIDAHKDTETTYYDKNVVYTKNFKGCYVTDTKHIPAFEKSNKSTAGSLARKDATLNYTYVDEIYKILEEKTDKIVHIVGPHCLNRRSQCRYQVDIYSAYIAVMTNCYIPADGFLSYEENAEMINFYVYYGKTFTNGSLITDNLKNYVVENELGEVEYMFSTPRQMGCYVGEVLKQKAYRSVESKAEVKNVHYGYYQKPFLKISDDKSCYIRNEKHRYEIFICSILSDLCFFMCNLRDAIGGKSIVTDAVHFDDFDSTTLDKIKMVLPDFFDYRVKDNESGELLYLTYATLKTEAEIKKERDKKRVLTDEQKARKLEMQRLRRAKKKAAEA